MITRAKLRSDPNQQLHTPTLTVTPGRKERNKNDSYTKSGKFKLPPADVSSIKSDIEEETDTGKYIDPNLTDTDESEAYGWYKEEEKIFKDKKTSQHNLLDNSLFSFKNDNDNDSLLQMSIKSYISKEKSIVLSEKSSQHQPNEEKTEHLQNNAEQNSLNDMSTSTYDQESKSSSDETDQHEKNTQYNAIYDTKASQNDNDNNINKKEEAESFDIIDEKHYELEEEEKEIENYSGDKSIENMSVVSEGTTKGGNTTRAEESSIEQEDDVNTVNSNNTASNTGGVQPPKYTRYRLMINPITEAEEASPDDTTPFTRIRSKLISFYQYMREIDSESQIMTWFIKDNFHFLPIDNVPNDVLGMKRYFQGIRGNMKNDRKNYISFSVHTPNDRKILEYKMQEWAESFGFTLLPCLIQSSTAKYVGWLAYSSYYTEMEDWKKGLQKNTGYEWGLKIVAVTNTDKDEKWNKRLKAVGLFVPTERGDQAQAEISKAMARVRQTSDRPCLATDRYLFVKPEEEMTTPRERTNYKHLLSRHRSHSEAIEGKLFNYIKVPLDRKILLKDKSKMTVRQMILSIKVEDKNSRLYQEPLFHMIDFVSDTSKLWMGNKTGPGGPAHVFTFYSPMAGEAQTMVRGIGRYIGRMYGSESASKIFDNAYWDTTKGWRWSDSKKKFETPEEKLLNGNMAHDYNLGTINILRQIQLEEEEKNKLSQPTQQTAMAIITPENEQSNEPRLNDLQSEAVGLLEEDIKDSNSEISKMTDITKAAMEEEQEIIRKIMNAEDENELEEQEGVQSEVTHVEFRDDTSVASSITQDSNNSARISGLSASSLESKKALKSSISKELLERLYEKGISAQEFKNRVNNYQIFRNHKKNIRKEAMIEEFIYQKKMHLVTEEKEEIIQEVEDKKNNDNHQYQLIQGEAHDKHENSFIKNQEEDEENVNNITQESHNGVNNSDVQVSSTDTDSVE